MGGVKVRSATQRVSVLSAAFFLGLTILSVKLIPARLFTFEADLRRQCTPGSISSPNIPYTGFPAVDTELCFMVSFFHIALDHPLASDFLVYFIGTSSIYVILPLLEGFRAAKSPKPSIWRRMLGYPEVWLALSQVASLGVTMCLYGLVFSVASASEPLAPNHPLEQEGDAKAGKRDEGDGPNVQGEPRYIGASRLDVESVATATFMGTALPSWALFAYREPSKTVIWQAFPLYVFVARVGYRTIVKATPHITRTSTTPSPPSHGSLPTSSQGGYNATRLVLLASSGISTYFHLSFLSTILSHPDAPILWTFLSSKSPSDVALALGNDALSMNVLIFLFWDFVFAFVSTFAALGFDALRDGEGVMDWVPTLVGCGLGCVVVGPGAMLALCVLGREERLRYTVGSPFDGRVRHPMSQ